MRIGIAHNVSALLLLHPHNLPHSINAGGFHFQFVLPYTAFNLNQRSMALCGLADWGNVFGVCSLSAPKDWTEQL